MKNARFERFGHMQRQYHRNRPWRLSQGGLFIPHSYVETKPDGLSWWDDVGFILGGRRVIVWWQHPRHVYASAIEDQSFTDAGTDPDEDWLFDSQTTNCKPEGRSRKKVVSYTCRKPSAEQQAYYDRRWGIQERLSGQGIEFEVAASWGRQRLNWATGISLVVPMEVRSATELAIVAKLARRLIPERTTLDAEFPAYRYGKADWLREQAIREADTEHAPKNSGLMEPPTAGTAP
jgi:hypothetical protein